jgi:hypothetical protein
MSLTESLVHLYFLAALFGYAVSILGQLFISDRGFPFFGVVAFLMTFLAGFIGQRRRPAFPMRPSRIWWVVVPVFAVSLLTIALLSGYRGAPMADGLPILAARPYYNFSRTKNVEAWRYLIVSFAFCIGWNTFALGFTIDLWRYWIARVRQSS